MTMANGDLVDPPSDFSSPVPTEVLVAGRPPYPFILSSQTIAAIQMSKDSTDVLAERYGLTPEEIEIIRGTMRLGAHSRLQSKAQQFMSQPPKHQPPDPDNPIIR
jgi:hypothetical protein